MDNELKSMLQGIQSSIGSLQEGQARLEEGQAVLQADVAGLKTDVADLKKGQALLQDGQDTLKALVGENTRRLTGLETKVTQIDNAVIRMENYFENKVRGLFDAVATLEDDNEKIKVVLANRGLMSEC
jgi:hypothetical protein